MASPGNQHCANCIGTLSFPILCLLKTADLHSLKKSGAVFCIYMVRSGTSPIGRWLPVSAFVTT